VDGSDRLIAFVANPTSEPITAEVRLAAPIVSAREVWDDRPGQCEVRVQHSVGVLGVGILGEGFEADQVAEQRRRDAPFLVPRERRDERCPARRAEASAVG